MIINTIPKVISANTWVAIDTEYFIPRSQKHRMHRPVGTFACMQVAVDGQDTYVITNPDLVQPMLDAIKDCVWVMHNGDFDIVHLRALPGVILPPRSKFWDTMYIERIMFNGYYTDFSLADLARRYLGIVLDKDVRSEFANSDPKPLTPEMLEYAVLDPEITLKVAKEQKKRISDADFKIWTKIDRDAFWAFMDFKGFRVNVRGWEELANFNLNKQEEMNAKIPFNPNSHVQVKQFFAKWFKLILKETGEDELLKVYNSSKTPEDAKQIINIILESRGYGKKASTYGLKLIENFIEFQDGVEVLIADYDINKAETGRTSCSSPNMQNIPARETKDYRKLFIPRPNHKLIIADYSAQEPRILAYVSKDKKLIQWFKENKDVYVEMAKEIFKKNIKKGDDERSTMKAVILGIDYGMSKYGLAKKLGCTADEAEKLIENVMLLLSDVGVWMNRQMKAKGKVTTPFGRTSSSQSIFSTVRTQCSQCPNSRRGSGHDESIVSVFT